MAQLLTGTTYTEPSTGITYTFDGNNWVQNSSGGTVVQNNDVSNAISQLMGSEGNVAQVQYPAGVFDVTPYSDFYSKAYEQLKPYYAQLLKEAGGDLDVALTNLERDYKTGTRTTVEDFTSAMQNLGVTLPQEDTALQGSLNKRGFALTENAGGGTTYAGGGLAKSELQSLNENQRLRTEAIQRTRQRGMESAAIQKLTGGETAQQSYRNTTEAQQREHESQATSLANQYQAADIAGKQSQIAKAEAGVDTGTQKSSVNPADASSIKSGYKGYAGWNDPAAIIADFAKTKGIGKE